MSPTSAVHSRTWVWLCTSLLIFLVWNAATAPGGLVFGCIGQPTVACFCSVELRPHNTVLQEAWYASCAALLYPSVLVYQFQWPLKRLASRCLEAAQRRLVRNSSMWAEVTSVEIRQPRLSFSTNFGLSAFSRKLAGLSAGAATVWQCLYPPFVYVLYTGYRKTGCDTSSFAVLIGTGCALVRLADDEQACMAI